MGNGGSLFISVLFSIAFFITPLWGEGFVGETLVVTPNGLVPIQELKKDDAIISYSFDNDSVEHDCVVATYHYKIKKVVVITTQGQEIVAAPDQVFYCPYPQNCWVHAEELTPSHSFAHYDDAGQLTSVGVDSVQEVFGDFDCYDVTVGDNHNFFISQGAVLVHNMIDTARAIGVGLWHVVRVGARFTAPFIAAAASNLMDKEKRKPRLRNSHYSPENNTHFSTLPTQYSEIRHSNVYQPAPSMPVHEGSDKPTKSTGAVAVPKPATEAKTTTPAATLGAAVTDGAAVDDPKAALRGKEKEKVAPTQRVFANNRTVVVSPQRAHLQPVPGMSLGKGSLSVSVDPSGASLPVRSPESLMIDVASIATMDLSKSLRKQYASYTAEQFQREIIAGWNKAGRFTHSSLENFALNYFRFYEFEGFREYVRAIPGYGQYMRNLQGYLEANPSFNKKMSKMFERIGSFKNKRHYGGALGFVGSHKDQHCFGLFVNHEAMRFDAAEKEALQRESSYIPQEIQRESVGKQEDVRSQEEAAGQGHVQEAQVDVLTTGDSPVDFAHLTQEQQDFMNAFGKMGEKGLEEFFADGAGADYQTPSDSEQHVSATGSGQLALSHGSEAGVEHDSAALGDGVGEIKGFSNAVGTSSVTVPPLSQIRYGQIEGSALGELSTRQLSQLGLRNAVADKTLGATGGALYSLARNGVRNYVVGSVVSNPFEAISKIPGIVQGVVDIGVGAIQKGYQFYQWLEERNERSRLEAIGNECFGEGLGELGVHPQGLHQPRQETASDKRGEPARPHARECGADPLKINNIRVEPTVEGIASCIEDLRKEVQRLGEVGKDNVLLTLLKAALDVVITKVAGYTQPDMLGVAADVIRLGYGFNQLGVQAINCQRLGQAGVTSQVYQIALQRYLQQLQQGVGQLNGQIDAFRLAHGSVSRTIATLARMLKGRLQRIAGLLTAENFPQAQTAQEEAEEDEAQEEEEEAAPQVGGQEPEDPEDSDGSGDEADRKTTVDDLFEEAKFVKESQKSRILEKSGNYQDTLRDFKRLGPKDIKKISMRDGKEVNVGRLPDGRTAIARNRSSGDNSPTLEIQAPGAKKVIKIRYMPNN